MADAVLLSGSTVRSPELRHEVPLAIVDPFLFVEVDGRRVVAIGELEIPRVDQLDGIEILPTESLGVRELRAQLPYKQAAFEIVARACRELGVTQAAVPGDFPLALARFLEAAGVALEPRDDVLVERRRRKSAAELAGIRAAQAAADASMALVRDLLAAADASGEAVTLDGAPLTSELLRAEILDVVRAHDAELEELIVSHGPQTAIGHGVGLELREQPGLARGFDTTFVAGEVLAIEPALYVGGFGGCRLEDVVLVADDGCEALTTHPHGLQP